MKINYILLADEAHPAERAGYDIAGASHSFFSRIFPTKEVPKTLVLRLSEITFDQESTIQCKVLMVDSDGRESLPLSAGDFTPRFTDGLSEAFAFIPFRLTFPAPGHYQIRAILANGSHAEATLAIQRTQSVG